MTKITPSSQKPHTRTRQQAKTPDISTLLKRHGCWYGSVKTRMEQQWLISFCYGILLVEHDTPVNQNAPDETMQTQIIGSWQLWTQTVVQQALTFTGKYQTVQSGPIRLRQFQTETQHLVYLMENLCAYLPQGKWSFWYLPAKQAVLVKDLDEQPYAVFAAFVPQIPIRPIEESKKGNSQSTSGLKPEACSPFARSEPD